MFDAFTMQIAIGPRPYDFLSDDVLRMIGATRLDCDEPTIVGHG
jgi:hypothetical protein